MKKQLHHFNQLLRRYQAYIRRRKNLMLANKNQRRQAILFKHIERLQISLTSLKLSLQKGSVVAGLVIGGVTINNQANAQSFSAAQTNPFSLVNTPYSGGLGSPAFFDLDNDGDLDMVCDGYFGSKFYYYENIGTSTSPAFDAPVDDTLGLLNFDSWSTIGFVDIDNDGDADAFDLHNGAFNFLENIGSATAPAFAAIVVNPFNLTYTGDYAVADYKDLDNDGDFDILAGNKYGNFRYYENTGNASTPSFAAYVENGMGLAYIGYEYAAPALGDVDLDGDLDLLAGSYDGNFHYYENTGTITAPAFATATSNPFGLSGTSQYYSTPTFVDLDADGDLDILSHTYNGTFLYYKNNSAELGLNEEASLSNLEIYPNPSNGLVTINFSEHVSNVNIEIIGIDGKMIHTSNNLTNHINLDVSTWSKGAYIVKVISDSGVATSSLIVK